MKLFLQVFAGFVAAALTHASLIAAEPAADPRAWFPISAGPNSPPIIAGLHKDSHYSSKTIRVLLVMHEADHASLLKSELWPANQADGVNGVVVSVVVVPPRKDAKLTLPPTGEFYNSKTQSDAQYLWRWIGMHAPDLVVEVVRGEDEVLLHVPKSAPIELQKLADHLPVRVSEFDDEPFTALNTNAACNVGVIPAMRLIAHDRESIERLLKVVAEIKLPPSPARREIQKRLARSPEEIAQQLLAVYGKKLDSVQYIPALAVVGRLREERILHGDNSPIPPLASSLVEPYLSGKKAALSPKSGGSDFAGHLLFGELAEMTGDKRYVELVKVVADRAFDADGKPREAMPAHNEMSDAVFMGCPILAQAGKLTGDEKYFDACLRNLLFMQKLCLRVDGLYRHSPLDEAAWGRGNGFPALGLAWSLSEIPETYKDREKIRAMFEAHLFAMLPHQDRGGAWRQVVDQPESYREFTVTSMTTYAMARGVRMGWLDRAKFGPAIDKGWFAIRARIGSDGGLVDVCTGTGKQKSLRDYYDRTAILGRDDRGGAMALMVTTEMQQYLKWSAAQKK